VHKWRVVTSRSVRFLLLAAVGVAGCGGLDDNRPPEWSYISPAIIQPNCATASCHSRGAAVAGLDLSTAEAGWNDLLRQKLPQVPGSPTGPMGRSNVPRQLVIPGNPGQSRVANMMRAFGAARMPPDRPLAEADIALVEEWILLGAQND
jgi:hypothetical protein